MTVSRAVLVAVALLLAGLVPAQPQSGSPSGQAPEPPQPWKEVRGFGKVLNLAQLPVVIDEPGLYSLQRDWNFEDFGVGIEMIQIVADDVTLDLHGFGISLPNGPVDTTIVSVRGDRATIRHGRISGCCEGVTAIRSAGYATRLDHLDVFSHDRMLFDDRAAVIAGSTIYSRDGVQLQNRSTIERSTVGCRYFCLLIQGEGNRIVDNVVQPYFALGVGIGGDGNLLASNTVDARGSADPIEAFRVTGSRNVLRGNHVLVGDAGEGVAPQVLFAVEGAGNTLDGNLAAPGASGARAQTGIEFSADGNFYGDNRLAAAVPFSLGGTTQTDWGGNVGY